MKCDLFWCNVVRSAGSDFRATKNGSGYFFDVHFKMSSQVLMKELTRMLINVRKIFNFRVSTAQKMKFSIKDFFSKCDQIRRFLWIWSHLLKISLMENLIFCAVVFQNELSV